MDLGFGIFCLVVLLLVFIGLIVVFIWFIKGKNSTAVEVGLFTTLLILPIVLVCFSIHDSSQPTYKDGEYKVCLVKEITLEQSEKANKYKVLDGNNIVKYFNVSDSIVKNDVETMEDAVVYKVRKYGDKDTYYYIHVPENSITFTIKG